MNTPRKGERLDLSSDPPGAKAAPSAKSAARPGQPYLGIYFACCGVYHRIYMNAAADAYVGACPRCARPIRIGIEPGGSDERFFTVK